MAHILIIDDEELIRKFLRAALEDAGYQVSEVSSVRTGHTYLLQGPVDLVLLDILMPDCDGLEAITLLRREFPDLPIIAMSGGGSVGHLDVLRVARQLGA